QLAIAAGEPLALEQSSIATRGHAIELRIYAEDPAAGYLPTTGPILRLIPPQGEHVRWDGGVAEGGAVTAAFDPMIAKLIVWGEDREQAVARARAALEATVLLGCQTNVAFLRALIDHPDFVTAAIHTGYLDAHPEAAEAAPPDHATLTRLLAAAALSTRPIRDVADSTPSLHAAIGDWRN
ncbi:MAG: biotin carboxylase, partial [Algiphilus sp.]